MMNLKAARESAGMSQKQVAITLKVSGPTVSQWESGKKTPTLENLRALASLYGVSLDYLAGNEKAPTPEGERKVDDDDIKFALWGDSENIDDEDLEDVKRYAEFVRQRKKDKRQ